MLEFCFGTRRPRGGAGRRGVNDFHSLECQIMDHADDVAYSCFDIVDGAKARFLTAGQDRGVARERDAGRGRSKSISASLLADDGQRQAAGEDEPGHRRADPQRVARAGRRIS